MVSVFSIILFADGWIDIYLETKISEVILTSLEINWILKEIGIGNHRKLIENSQSKIREIKVMWANG